MTCPFCQDVDLQPVSLCQCQGDGVVRPSNYGTPSCQTAVVRCPECMGTGGERVWRCYECGYEQEEP